MTLASAYDNVTSILLCRTLGRMGFVGCDHYEFSSFDRTCVTASGRPSRIKNSNLKLRALVSATSDLPSQLPAIFKKV